MVSQAPSRCVREEGDQSLRWLVGASGEIVYIRPCFERKCLPSRFYLPTTWTKPTRDDGLLDCPDGFLSFLGFHFCRSYSLWLGSRLWILVWRATIAACLHTGRLSNLSHFTMDLASGGGLWSLSRICCALDRYFSLVLDVEFAAGCCKPALGEHSPCLGTSSIPVKV